MSHRQNCFQQVCHPCRILMLLLLAGGQQVLAQNSRVIRAQSAAIEYRIDDKRATWNINPKGGLKVFPVPVGARGHSKVIFKTEADSIAYTVKLHQKIRFLVVHNGDTVKAQLTGVPKRANFSDSYIKKHKGKFEVAIPEVQELAKIMVALSTGGSTDSGITNMRTAYYQKVKAHFSPFKHHPVIDSISKYIKGETDSSYWHYYTWKMSANAYAFTPGGKIVNKGIIRDMSFQEPGAPTDPFVKHAALVADFAAQSGFRKFYAAHRPFYDSLLKAYKTFIPLQDMKDWLEKHYPYQYDYFFITFSPLTAGAHSTGIFEDNGFHQTVMYVAAVSVNSRYNEAVNAMLNSRVVFTEIDHNYDNPVSDQYITEINDAMKDKSKWGKGIPDKGAYDSPLDMFKEYMTWAVFSLYCLDKYSESDVMTFVDRMETQMEQRRGFNNFKAFNRELIRLYRHYNKTRKAHELYPEMIAWCKKQ